MKTEVTRLDPGAALRCAGGPPEGLGKCDDPGLWKVEDKPKNEEERQLATLAIYCQNHIPISILEALGDTSDWAVGLTAVVTTIKEEPAEQEPAAQAGMFDMALEDQALANALADRVDRMDYLRRALAEAEALEDGLLDDVDAYFREAGRPLEVGKHRIALAERHIIEIEVQVPERRVKLRGSTPTPFSAAVEAAKNHDQSDQAAAQDQAEKPKRRRRRREAKA